MSRQLKRMALCILVLVFAMSNLCVAALAAGNEFGWNLTPTGSGNDERVKVSVTTDGTVKLAAFTLELKCDPEVFELAHTADGEEFAWEVDLLLDAGNLVVEENEAGDGYRFVWFYGRNVTGVNVMDIYLKVKPGVAGGEYEISMACIDAYNAAETPIDMEFADGGTKLVSVSGNNEVPESGEGTELFPDVDGHWAEAEILKAAELGLVNGYPDGSYRADDTMTRAMCVTILWRAAGCPEPSGSASFVDLDPKQEWYWKAVAWAEENAVVYGVGEGKFDPNGAVTREQLATILHRMAGTPLGMELLFASYYDSAYTDSSQISGWAKNAVYWSICNEILCGADNLRLGTELSPKAYANRAQIAVMMVRYLNFE